MLNIRTSSILFCALAGMSLAQDTRPYQQHEPSPGGTGKIYMGREISLVMGYEGAAWLERDDRQQEERTDLLLKNLPLDADDVVADIGAGSGYFTFRLAPMVPRGKVFAVDIQPEMLAILRARIKETNHQHVAPIKGSVVTPNLPASSVDLALMVDVYHEFSHPYEMMTALIKALKPGGKVVLVEYRGEDPTVPIKPLHKMTQAQARKEMQAVGLVWRETLDMLPWQHIMIFAKP
jgi:FkbM family methyltransferase